MNETIKALTTRKSAKSYLDRHIDKVLIEQIVAAEYFMSEAHLKAETGKITVRRSV